MRMNLYESLSAVRTFCDSVFRVKPGLRLFRVIRSIPDKEGKTRDIAIGDYFSQTVLRPFHKYLFKVLRRIPQDCTFDQGSFKGFMATQQGPFYSVDLSAATDRFPIKLISTILKTHFKSELIDS